MNIDRSWTLFLDRDGVINRKRESDYVKSWDEFEFLPGVLKALSAFSGVFGRIIILTNQRCIGRHIITDSELAGIHERMTEEIEKNGGRIDAIYICPHLDEDNCGCRKPKNGLALKAKEDFPDIDFSRSIIAGDSASDLEVGRSLGMVRILIGEEDVKAGFDLRYGSLCEFQTTLAD